MSKWTVIFDDGQIGKDGHFYKTLICLGYRPLLGRFNHLMVLLARLNTVTEQLKPIPIMMKMLQQQALIGGQTCLQLGKRLTMLNKLRLRRQRIHLNEARGKRQLPLE
jgi:hypothetical protein